MSANEGLAALKIDRSRRRSGIGSWLWLIAIFAVIAAIATPLVLQQMNIVEVQIATASKTTPGTQSEGANPGGIALSAAGYVVADRQSVLAAKVTGRLTKMNVAESQFVKKDFVVAEVDHTELDAMIAMTKSEYLETVAEVERLKQLAAQTRKEVEAARAPLQTYDAQISEMQIMLTDAERRLKRDKALADGRALPASEVEDRVTEVQMAKAKIGTIDQRKIETAQTIAVSETRALVADRSVNVAQARGEMIQNRLKVLDAQLKDYFVHAPFDGVISEKAAEVGEIVAPISVGGQMARGSVATLADWNSLQAEVDVSETMIAKVKPGMRAAITVDAIPDKMFPGKVRRILPRANRSKATVQVRVDFIERDEKAILPEMGIRVQFLDDAAPQGMESGLVKAQVVVPQEAVVKESAGTIVWVIAENQAMRRTVKTGATENNRTVILEGISAGERVAVRGMDRITADKQPVKVVEPTTAKPEGRQ